MLDGIDKFLLYGSLIKWAVGEPLTVQEIERVIKLFETTPLQTAQADPATMSGLQMRLRDSLRKYYEQPK